MTIRRATYADIDALMIIFANARKIMHSCGNLHQWDESYPSREIISADVSNGNCHVLMDGDEIIGTMTLEPGPDPTYSIIDGEWPNNDPYFVIHRIAAAVSGRNVAERLIHHAFECALSVDCKIIRIDTHKDNVIMKHILDTHGFAFCGVIQLENGSKRDAYIKMHV